MAYEFDPNDPFRNPAMDALVGDLKKLSEQHPDPKERKVWRELLKIALLAQADFEQEIEDIINRTAPPPYGNLPAWRDDDLLDAIDDDSSDGSDEL